MYCLTKLSTHTRYYYNEIGALYDAIYHISGDHEQSEEMASWAELAPSGDNWTNEDIGIDISIVEEG